jgi:plastocyanin
MLEQAHLRAPALAAGLVAAALGGCGGGGSYDKSGSKSSTTPAPAPAAAAQRVPVKADADGGLYFEPKRLEAKAGSVTLVMTNPKSTGKEHGIAVRGNGIDRDGPVTPPGGTVSVTANLKPGKYTFYCDYEDHAKRGMKGTLTVK